MAKAPYYLIALLNCHTLPQPGVNDEILDELQRDGLIERGTGSIQWNTTQRGQVYATLLGEVPLPVQKWVDPRKER